MSNFAFISNSVLRSNLDLVFAHIVDLLSLTKSGQFENQKLAISNLRKTIIIHTAAIIEALLLWRLKKVVKTKKVTLAKDWVYKNMKTIYKVSPNKQIVAGIRQKDLVSS